jgi:eukaryotic-like serine/threonine-protein kinase
MAKEPQFTSAQSHSARVPPRDEASSSDQATRATARQPSTQDALDAAYDEYCQRLANGEALDHDLLRAACLEWENVLTPSLAADGELSWPLGCREPAWPQVGDELLGFRLLEELGRGAFARVFRATDTQLGGRQVALKLCHTDSDEAWILGRLEHPHIVPVYSVRCDVESGLTAICMPYLGCITLHDVISMSWKSMKPPQRITLSGDKEAARDEQQPPHRKGNRSTRSVCYLDVMLHIGASIAEALAHAHSKGVLHLDVKPSNVLVNDRGCARLMDFNLAADKSKGIPRIGGTLQYMSPEQASCFLEGRDGRDLDQRSDVFSLGVMLYQMLCGYLPYGRIPERLSSKAVVEDLVNPQRLNRSMLWSGQEIIHHRIRRVVERCLAIDPDKRYPSVAAVAKDLKRELSPVAKAGRWMDRLICLFIRSFYFVTYILPKRPTQTCTPKRAATVSDAYLGECAPQVAAPLHPFQSE